jgi:hypothetical protein
MPPSGGMFAFAPHCGDTYTWNVCRAMKDAEYPHSIPKQSHQFLVTQQMRS